MLRWLKDFLVDKQTFVSAVGDLAALGAVVAATPEAQTAPGYQEALVAAKDDSTVRSRSYTGKPARALRTERTDEWEAKADEIQPFPAQAVISSREGVMDYMGRGEHRDMKRMFMPSGQGVGLIREIKPAGEVFADIVREAEETLQELTKLATPASV